MKENDTVGEALRNLREHLDEKSFRLAVGMRCMGMERGTITHVAKEAGLSRTTIYRAIGELKGWDGKPQKGRVRKPGGGRKKAREVYGSLTRHIEELVYPGLRGDPESPLLWTTKSTRHLTRELKQLNICVSHVTVAKTLAEMDFSLQANSKVIEEGSDHPDRDAQFRYINDKVKEYLGSKDPVISVDTKKKELVGNYANKGREWTMQGMPTEVKMHDFLEEEGKKVIPYGVYDLTYNIGFVNLGQDHDTAAFSVESIRRWFYRLGKPRYPSSKRLLITADGGGSNGYRLRTWKTELAKLATELGIEISVCHFPPGTSKWNKIEHRLFSQISQSWRGRPLLSVEVIINLIRNTATATGLKVFAEVDHGVYSPGIKIQPNDIDALNLKRHVFHGDWNYTLAP